MEVKLYPLERNYPWHGTSKSRIYGNIPNTNALVSSVRGVSSVPGVLDVPSNVIQELIKANNYIHIDFSAKYSRFIIYTLTEQSI